MKKNVIALLLAIVLAAGSIGTATVFATEITAEEAVAVEKEESLEEEVPEEIEGTDTGLTAGDVSEEETIQAGEEEPVQKNEENLEMEDSTEEQNEPVVTEDSAEATAPEEETSDPSSTETVSLEIAETEEPEEIEAEVLVADDNEAKSATSGKCGTNATWSISGTTLTISGSGAMTDFYCNKVTDEEYWWYDTDQPWYNYRESIKEVIIKDGIICIGNNAFYDCPYLTRVTIPDSVNTIGKGAFTETGINCIYINSLKGWLNIFDKGSELSGELYLKEKLLTDITIPDSVTGIRDKAFHGCRSIKSVKIPSGVTSIGKIAFCGCGLTNVMIPSGVKSIEESAFSNCINLTSITIPNSVTSIGKGAFSGCYKLKNIKLPTGVKSIEDKTFYHCIDLTSITIPEGVTSIGSTVFEDCFCLESAIIPSSVKSIGDLAFNQCTGLTSITIPNNVVSIGYGALYNCMKIKNITIPSSVKYIGDDLFGGNKVVDIVFNGAKDQWEAIEGSNKVVYKTITYMLVSNTFSVDADIQLPKTAYNYTGNQVKPAVNVTYNGKQLVQGKDYTLTYENNINIGTATVNVNGIGSYSGTAKLQYRIRLGNPPKVTCINVASGMKVSWEKVSGATRYKVYRDGKLIFTTSALVVTDKDVKYKGGTKFVYKVVATEKNTGDSDLFKTATYYRLMPVGIKSLTNPSAGKMTVAYDRSTGSSGYVVRYGLKSDMSDAKVITVQGEKTLSRTFGGMKKGKTYYVQVRTYKIDNGVRYYSGYCTTKTITIKK